MKKPNTIRWLAAVLILVLSVCSAGWAALTAEQMYLDPSLVPTDYYDYEDHPVGYTMVFEDVQGLQVLPTLQQTGTEYYFTPTVDYSGDITGTDGSITFDRAGPYFVLATYTDSSTELFDVGIGGFRMLQGSHQTAAWRTLPAPDGGDVVVVDPDVANPPWTYSGNPTVKDDLDTWQKVTDYLKTVTNKHVELQGHGAPGQFYYKGQKVLDDCTDATKEWLNSMKGHINNLTFISCSTGKGTAGDDFLEQVAEYLGASAGYTDVIGDTPGTGKWFINDDGYHKIVPAPGGILLVSIGVCFVGWLRRRKAL